MKMARFIISVFVVFFLAVELVPFQWYNLQADSMELAEGQDHEKEKEGKEKKNGSSVDEYVAVVVSGSSNNEINKRSIFITYLHRYIRPVLEGPLMPPEIA